MNKLDEQIIVAPREKVFQNESLTFQGVNSDKEILKQIMDNVGDNYSVMRRGDAEVDVKFKQPIPYAVLKRGEEVFVYERLQGGGETRLHNQLSLGVGGHMNHFETETFSELTFENLQRELFEELYIDCAEIHSNTIGLINDDHNEVGEVHLGLLISVNLDGKAEVSVRETDQLRGRWVNVSDLRDPEVYDQLESWSQFVADILN